MSNRNMALDVIVRLKDLLTGPLRRLRSTLDGIAGMARKIGLVGGAVAAISFMGPIQEAAAFQQQLLDIAGTSNLVGKAAFDLVEKSKAQYEDLALKVGQYSDVIAKGAGQMVAAGLDPGLVDASLLSIGKASKAANADFGDMAAVATSMLQTLKLPADQLDDALAGLIVAGKEGAFELKDMAKYFPTLTGQMAKLGVTGREAATQLGTMLQIARKGTADPAEAANNLNNFLSKITSPETVKNFKKMNVDILKVMQNAAIQGINPIEAVVQKISKLTGVSGKEIEGMLKKAEANGFKGADALEEVRKQLEAIYGAGKLGELFSDMQVMGFLIPMLANIDEYKRIKEEVANATGAMSDADFETQMKSLNTQLITFNEIGTQAGREVGFAFGSWLPMINENLSSLLKWLRETDKATGGMVRQALSLAGAGVIAAAGIGALGLILPVIGAGLSALAALVSPVGIALAAIAAGAYLVYRNWSTVSPRLSRIWDSIKSGFSAFGALALDIGRRVVTAGQEMVDRYGPAVMNGIGKAWDWASSAAVSAWSVISDTGAKLVTAGQEVADRYGPAVMNGIGKAWDWASSAAVSAWSVISDTGAKLITAGQEMVGRYGPILKEGMGAALTDVSAGWENLKKLLSGFSEGLAFDVDLSGLTIDSAKIAAFEALDVALKGIRAGWQALKDFGSGFAPYLAPIGENLGGSVKAIIEIGSGMLRLARALGSLINIDMSKADGIAKWIGGFAGGTIEVASFTLRTFYEALADLVTVVADLAEGKRSLESLVPKGIADAWRDGSQAVNDFLTAIRAMPADFYNAGIDAGQKMVDGVKGKVDELVEWFKALPTRIIGAVGKIDFGNLISWPSLPSWLGGGTPGAANDNARVPNAIAAAQAPMPAQAPPQTLNVSTQATVKVEGPGRVVEQETNVSSPSPNVNTGRVIGRN
ncbi:phage tail tape measure protein [Rhizobium sp. SL86]|uniref:phage tail tape measure protein n=1 Tax=Rhizobium sp. SL86 TaxID=2995148 RepID=UPI0022765EAB|nr:phage tail tape measure protein [Rhizobium sp. SL86]MCY1666240.1 phage tail tape measure protein [Rhizobium sp. SL86]